VVLVRILMSKSGFEDEVLLIKLIVGVVKHLTIDELGPVDYRDIEAAPIDFCRQQLRRESQ
jgi:hypothetical protein